MSSLFDTNSVWSLYDRVSLMCKSSAVVLDYKPSGEALGKIEGWQVRLGYTNTGEFQQTQLILSVLMPKITAY